MNNKKKLKKLGLWKQYKKNTKSHKCLGVGMKTAKRIGYDVSSSFSWVCTKEGGLFWRNVHVKHRV